MQQGPYARDLRRHAVAAEAFASHHASQCGYCTPGFVVATHAAIQRCASRGITPTIEALQQGIDGNLCRCTGYRPILDACRVRFFANAFKFPA